MLDEILEAKGYARAKSICDAADTAEARKRLPTGGMFDLVREIERDLMKEAYDARRVHD